MKRDFTAIFCFVDDFIKNYNQDLVAINSSKTKTGPKSSLNLSEVVTILIGFHQSSLDCFKHYYLEIILPCHSDDFALLRYEHFTKLTGTALPFLTLLLDSLFEKCDGISFVDSTSIAVCKNYRIYSHKVFQGFAARSRTTKSWFYGLKLHLIINLEGSIVKASFSSGNRDDRKHFYSMTEGIFGKVFGDRGYISKKMFNDLWDKDIQLITRVKQGMKNMLLSITDKLLLLKRVLIETVIGRIKLLDKFEHTRHRSPINALSHMVASLINYQLLPIKPSIKTLLQLDLSSSIS
jgi:hypothetical protein